MRETGVEKGSTLKGVPQTRHPATSVSTTFTSKAMPSLPSVLRRTPLAKVGTAKAPPRISSSIHGGAHGECDGCNHARPP